jgi:hypothetical protein
MNYLIGVSGKAGHGKDSVVSFLKQCLVEDGDSVAYKEIKYADKLKEIVADLLDVDMWYMNDQAGKETAIPHMGGITGRRALQIFGTDIARQIFSDIWVYHYTKAVSNFFTVSIDIDHHIVFTSDVRFENEYNAIKRYKDVLTIKPVLIRVIRPGFSIVGGENHASETGLDHINGWDYKLVAKNLTELGEQTREIYESIIN